MADLEIDTWAPRVGQRTRVLSVVHESVEMAAWVRCALEAVEVAAIAVELPPSFAGALLRAVGRLPRISAVFDVAPGSAATRLFVCAPGDPFVEALRFARERELRTALIDADIEVTAPTTETAPDTYALWELGPSRYMALLEEALPASSPGSVDALREAIMVHRIQELERTVEVPGDIVALVGAAHARNVRAQLERPQPRPLARELRRQVEVRHVEPESLAAMVAEAPLLHAAWELLRDGEVPEASEPAAVVSPKLSLRVSGRGLQLIQGGDGLADGETAPERVFELSRYAAAYAARRVSSGCSVFGPDRRRIEDRVWRAAALSYREQTTTLPAPWQRRTFFDFARRYARFQGRLTAGLYEWVVAARGVADDILAWEVFDAARAYPWQSGEQDILSVSADGEELDLGTRRLRFRRWSFQVKRPRLQLKPRPVPDDPQDWLAGFDGGLCSYPPEDLVIEDFGRELGKRSVAVLTTERCRVERFQSGLLDGIDLRETVRRRATEAGSPQPGPQLWVREEGRVPGACGAVVMIFDSDEDDSVFPYRMTWLGEHDEESDMAFYSTPPLEQIVGPGITRATYGGLMMSRPPGRLFDVWRDPDYAGLGSKAELLLIAAIDYSEERIVTHVARQAPASWITAYALRQGKQVVHLPLASLSPRTLAGVRVMHMLAGRDKREVAPRYVW